LDLDALGNAAALLEDLRHATAGCAQSACRACGGRS
jgi:hypothetical protein